LVPGVALDLPHELLEVEQHDVIEKPGDTFGRGAACLRAHSPAKSLDGVRTGPESD
jgi:hypothetical protein